MKRQDYVFGSTTSNIEEQTPEALNNGWVELSILYSRVLNGVCAALSQSTNIVSQEVANAIVGMGVALNPASDNQLLQVLQKLAIKATDFESPITASNKGATMKELEEVVTSSFRFKGYVSTTQPTGNLVVDNLWINLSTMPSTFPVSASLIKKWNGSTWVNYGSSYTPMNFDAFRNNNDNEGYYWFGGQWKLLSTDLSTDYFRLNQTSGKWEIKSSVNLPGTPTCDTPSASNTRAIVNVDFVNNNTISSRNFTNCLTEIPQDIKLELAGGTLTLKAGSKIHLAHGDLETTATTTSDISVTQTNAGQYIVIRSSKTALYLANIETCLSGTIANRPTSLERSTGLYFATDENKMYLSGDKGANWYSGADYSLPLGIITVSNGAISSIDQVFNGFGYIGSTIFALPGVKGLIPNGRNEDGTLKNIDFTTNSVLTQTTTSGTFTRPVVLNAYTLGFNASASYDEKNNTVSTGNYIIVGSGSFTNGHVTSFEPKTTFHAVDYNDFENTVEEINSSISAVNSSAIHKTGNETMAGVKTFSSAPILNSATASTVPVLSSTKQIVSSAVTATELGYLDGVTSAIQTQLNGKQATVSGAATTITSSNLTASRAVVSNSSGKVAVSDTTSTELGYVHGVTSAIQTQLNGKANTAASNFTAAGKGTIVNLTVPNYSAGVAFTLNKTTPYTAPKDGFVFIYTGRANDQYSNIKIGGTQVGYSISNWSTIQYFFPVAKGTVVSTDYDSIGSARFYPLKGAN